MTAQILPDVTRNRFSRDLPFPAYLALPALHFHGLAHMGVSPRAYAYRQRNPIGETQPMRMGRAAHCLTLTPLEADRQLAFLDTGSRRNKEWKTFAANPDHDGKTLLLADEYETSVCIAAEVRNDPVAWSYLADGEPEVSILWEYEGAAVKCRGDSLRVSAPRLVELKSTRFATEREFLADYFRRGYHVQAGLYCEGFRRVTGEDPEYLCIAALNRDEHDVAVYPVPPEVLRAGWNTARGWMDRVLECQVTGHWPGVADGKLMRPVEMPAWATAALALDLSGLEEA